jgi:hypothetical protein
MLNDPGGNDNDSVADETHQEPVFPEVLLEMNTEFLVLSHSRVGISSIPSLNSRSGRFANSPRRSQHGS